MTDSNVKKWYALRAVSGQENKVKAYIDTEVARLGIEDYVSQVLVPTEKVVTVKDGKKTTKDKVYYSGYIMIEANLTGEIPHIIKSVTNVIGFLGETKNGDPVPLRQSEVNRMLGVVDELNVNTDSGSAVPYTFGETIKVIDGPFNGFNGTVEKINEEKRKLEVMVKIFGRKTPLELSFTQVEKV
jgi:transcription termination/antitermination protein NusG